ncbi:MAG: hypothetical protein WC330_08845 [Candidatus Omnitrophota bacterium]|jgi:GTPase
MHAEFIVKSCFSLPGLGVIVSGEVTFGNIKEGAQGKSPSGKLVTVVRMDNQGAKVQIARVKDKVNIVMKGINVSDVRAGMAINFF